jgi:hypothetical protein
VYEFAAPVVAVFRYEQIYVSLNMIYAGTTALNWFTSSTTVKGIDLDTWLLQSIATLQVRLQPGGVRGLSRSFLQAVTAGTDRRGLQYRIDIDNLSGWNLRFME